MRRKKEVAFPFFGVASSFANVGHSIPERLDSRPVSVLCGSQFGGRRITSRACGANRWRCPRRPSDSRTRDTLRISTPFSQFASQHPRRSLQRQEPLLTQRSHCHKPYGCLGTETRCGREREKRTQTTTRCDAWGVLLSCNRATSYGVPLAPWRIGRCRVRSRGLLCHRPRHEDRPGYVVEDIPGDGPMCVKDVYTSISIAVSLRCCSAICPRSKDHHAGKIYKVKRCPLARESSNEMEHSESALRATSAAVNLHRSPSKSLGD